MNNSIQREKRTVITDNDGFAIGFKVETYEWNPPKIIRGTSGSKSTNALKSLKAGETKRIVHGDLRYYSGGYKNDKNARHCSLASVICKLRKIGWEIEHYHEKDHVIVVRRLK